VSELKVIQMPEQKAESGAGVIQRLEEALEMAKAGEVENCFIVFTLTNGNIADCWANRTRPYLMVGAIESAKRDFMNAAMDQR
jgi:hypothetical protein